MAEFSPQPIKLQGKEYLEVAQRIVWLRQEHPDAQIITAVQEHDRAEGYALIFCTITIPSTGGIGTGWGSASRKDLRGPVASAYLEKAETRAKGRACADLGYGTLAALQEDGDTLADAPVESRRAQQPQDARNGQQATPNTATPANAARPPASAVTESSQPARATDAQQAQIRDLVGPAGMTVDTLLQHQGLTALADFTEAKAARIIERLKAKAAQSAPDPNSPVADTPRLQAVR